jgi:acyl carrier protein
MSDRALKAEIVDVLSVTLRVPCDRITEEFSPAECDTWDSVRHLMIMLAIEDRFGITFDEREITELTNVATISSAVQTHLLAK